MADEWPDLPAGKGYPLIDTTTWKFGAPIEAQLNLTIVEEGSEHFALFNAQSAFLVDPQSVYATHIRTTALSTSDSYVDARGQDAGAGGIFLVSSKVAGAAAAVKLVQNPGSSTVFQIDSYASAASHIENHYAGSAGKYFRMRAERGYIDGQMTSGSDVLTSATAAFTAGDVGKVVSAISYSRQVFGPSSVITATVSEYLSATQVRLSRTATRTENPMYFTITNRTPGASQNIEQVIDTDGSKILYKRAYGWHIANTPLLPAADDAHALYIDSGSVSQSAAVMRVRVKDESNVSKEAVQVGNLGHFRSYVGASFDNSSRTASTSAAVSVKNLGVSASGKAFEVISNDVVGADLVQYKNAAGTVLSRVSFDGRDVLMHTTAPADAHLAVSQAAFYWDPTPGAEKLMLKGKNSAGAVVTKTVA